MKKYTEINYKGYTLRYSDKRFDINGNAVYTAEIYDCNNQNISTKVSKKMFAYRTNYGKNRFYTQTYNIEEDFKNMIDLEK